MEYEGYRSVRASDLPPKEQDRLRRALQHELTEALIRSVKTNPPDLELSEVELVLQPGQELADFDAAADCLTCLTCITCGTA